MQPRPHREDICDEDVRPADILHELRLFRWEFDRYRGETNGDLAWLRSFRAKVNDFARFFFVLAGVLSAAWVALHLGGSL